MEHKKRREEGGERRVEEVGGRSVQKKKKRRKIYIRYKKDRRIDTCSKRKQRNKKVQVRERL